MIKLLKKIRLSGLFLALLVFILGHIAGINPVAPFFLLSIYLYCKLRGLIVKNASLLNLSLLFLIIFTSGYLILTNNLPLYFIPFSVVPMLLMLLFSSLELSLIIPLAAAVSLSVTGKFSLELIPLFLTSAILSALLVKGARKRSTIIRAGAISGLAQLVIFIFTRSPETGLSYQGIYFLINGLISSIIVLGVLPIFEYLFGAITNISLLELADFHQPLLERLIQETPGTYHHSLIVGNLSETASRAIGANALLSRVGAYYHDIGKLQKPEYFSENQDKTASKHDAFSPAMSKLVIMKHVKEGVGLAKKYKLNPALIDFIEQHHGKSLVYYFYLRALENPKEDQEVEEEGYRYPGPKPRSKETAIVLLADSVEAAARSLKDPDPAAIGDLVHKIINNKFIDGQLDECDLKLKDLEKISAVFIKLLCGIYHSRASYPEKENNQI
ncbi:MAG: HDIG domain-containing protein [Candidatus Omnitrophica bacterium]|nr:HDIG domain-containing protein [Candidatus Omnitrophota bacterium]